MYFYFDTYYALNNLLRSLYFIVIFYNRQYARDPETQKGCSRVGSKKGYQRKVNKKGRAIADSA